MKSYVAQLPAVSSTANFRLISPFDSTTPAPASLDHSFRVTGVVGGLTSQSDEELAPAAAWNALDTQQHASAQYVVAAISEQVRRPCVARRRGSHARARAPAAGGAGAGVPRGYT
jgi:hypothetical protein